MKKKNEVNVRDTAIAGSYFELFCMLLTMFDIQLNHKRLLWQLVIGNWALGIGHLEQCTDLIE